VRLVRRSRAPNQRLAEGLPSPCEVQLDAPIPAPHRGLSGFRESHAVDAAQQVYPHRLEADGDHRIRLQQHVVRNGGWLKSKLNERRPQPVSIGGRRVEEHVDVLGEPRISMKRQIQYPHMVAGFWR
jgi:hypothetical protein